jgi:hypothetical protein
VLQLLPLTAATAVVPTDDGVRGQRLLHSQQHLTRHACNIHVGTSCKVACFHDHSNVVIDSAAQLPQNHGQSQQSLPLCARHRTSAVSVLMMATDRAMATQP